MHKVMTLVIIVLGLLASQALYCREKAKTVTHREPTEQVQAQEPRSFNLKHMDNKHGW